MNRRVLAVLLVLVGCDGSQFVSRMYTEALGRGPDLDGWRSHLDDFRNNGCNQDRLVAVAQGFFGSSEYQNIGYNSGEQALTVFRAMLGRDPTQTEWQDTKTQLEGGTPITTIVMFLGNLPEFTQYWQSACLGKSYARDASGHPGGFVPPPTLTVSWTDDDLKNCLTQKVCNVPQSAVVELHSTIHVPPGHTLQTAGNPPPHQYARQARLVRAFNASAQNNPTDCPPDGTVANHPFIVLDRSATAGGATIQDIWVDGQRNRFQPPCDGNFHNVGGGESTVNEIRSDDPLLRAHIGLGVPRTGAATIRDSLFVSYSAQHFGGDSLRVTDGLQIFHPNATVFNNAIIDATDVGIVVFGQGDLDPGQGSEVYDNLILAAGNSAQAALNLNAVSSTCTGNKCVFIGRGIHDNTIVAGMYHHFDIILAAGTAQWRVPQGSCGQSGSEFCGTGGTIQNNRTIPGYENGRVNSQIAIAVDGMANASVGCNALLDKVSSLHEGKCYTAAGANAVVYHQAHAGGGSLCDTAVERSTDGCIETGGEFSE